MIFGNLKEINNHEKIRSNSGVRIGSPAFWRSWMYSSAFFSMSAGLELAVT